MQQTAAYLAAMMFAINTITVGCFLVETRRTRRRILAFLRVAVENCDEAAVTAIMAQSLAFGVRTELVRSKAAPNGKTAIQVLRRAGR